ncbi:hypothetical protein [Pseudonocardia broussonetiae]|uniref:Universal stress protein family protein n=1 Tax=Pseudonocardia broussonetiae TaxID=2736640 RepID=A0A6M6JUK1_9PSEU|nr:hypothetical protein [Pseudonocardia broussonetiae]QJY51140.1 hypothetical protein HOP40_34730 [Pseudonocardia broussonetiae]
MTTPTIAPYAPPTAEHPTQPIARPDGRAHGPQTAPQELLVALCDPADLTRSLVAAATRARAEQRPLTVVIVEPARAWTIDAAVIAVQDRRRARELASWTTAARTLCARVGVDIGEVLVLRPGWAWTREGRRRAISTRLDALARRRGAELHPLPYTARDTARRATAPRGTARASNRSAEHSLVGGAEAGAR